jgi:CMP-N,N'-diacetyllegionaminic acid synthase
MKKIYAIIPARSGSKGVKDKNLLKIKNRSLLDWSISAALRCESIDRVFVSTDSEKYADIALSCGAEIPFMRPKKYSLDNSPDIDFITHALNEFKKFNEEPDLLVHLRPTTPLRDPLIIEQAIEKVLHSKNSTSLRSVHQMPESSYKTLEINSDGMLTPLKFLSDKNIDINAPRQQFPNTYQANGYVDILLTSTIRKTNQMHGENIFAFKTDVITEIDSIDDFEYIEYQASKYTDIYSKVFS